MNDFDWGATELILHSSLTKEDWDKLTDAELENTVSITFQTPQGKQVKYIKSDVLDKIRAEIENKYESISDTFHHYETGFTDALEWVLSIIDKYQAESEEKEK